MMRRRILPGVAVLVSILVGALGGVIFVRQSPATFASTPKHSAHPSPSHDTFGSPLAPAKVVSAMHALGAKQTSSDVFPVPSFITTTDVLPASIHFVMTTDDGSKLWIGRTSAALCLLFSSGDPSPADGIDAGSTCQPPTQFAESGLTLREGNDLWTWNGASFTTTIAPPELP